jgi:hypothetical protein
MGYCPNCKADIPTSSVECSKCGALFGAGSAWSPKPSLAPVNLPFIFRSDLLAIPILAWVVWWFLYALFSIPFWLIIFWPGVLLAVAYAYIAILGLIEYRRKEEATFRFYIAVIAPAVFFVAQRIVIWVFRITHGL